jgi:hypothetical protein
LAEKRGEPYPALEKVRDTAKRWRDVWWEANKEDRIVMYLTALTSITLPYPVEACIITGKLASSFHNQPINAHSTLLKKVAQMIASKNLRTSLQVTFKLIANQADFFFC